MEREGKCQANQMWQQRGNQVPQQWTRQNIVITRL